MLFMFVSFLFCLCVCTSSGQKIRHILQTAPVLSIHNSYVLNDCSLYQFYTAYTYLNFWHRCLIRVILFFSLNSSIVHIIYSCNLSHCVVVKCTLHIYIYIYTYMFDGISCVCVCVCVRARVCVLLVILFDLLFNTTYSCKLLYCGVVISYCLCMFS